MSHQIEASMEQRKFGDRVAVAIVAAILFAVLATALVAGVLWFSNFTKPPSAARQSEEVAALQTHVLPLVKDLKVTGYLNEGPGSGSIRWKRGSFAEDLSRANEDGDDPFDHETKAAYDRFVEAIQASGVPTDRLYEAQFADDGSLRSASFQRRGGGLKWVFTYIYSPGAKPAEWTSNLGPVILTRIGDSDWWFEQSPND